MTARTGPLRVAVIGGGANCEHEVSLASATAVRQALDDDRYDVVPLTIGRAGEWFVDGGAEVGLAGAVAMLQACDVVLPVVHGPHGEDGALATLCELAGVPYVGCPPLAGAVAMDKSLTKLVAAQVGVRTARGVVVRRADQARWAGPCVVKPVRAGSSHGVSLVQRADGLAAAVEGALAVDERVLVENVVHGREIDLAVVDLPGGGRAVSPPLEVVTDGVFGLAEKYDGSADFRLPAALSAAELAALSDGALRMYDALGCRGLARVDFFLTADGPVLNEVNTMPGLSARSQLPRMMRSAGWDYPALLDLLIEVALDDAHDEVTPARGPAVIA